MDNKILEILHLIKAFELSVDNVSRDIFVGRAKEFFENYFSARSSFWLQLPEDTLNLPPILRCHHALKKQKANNLSWVEAVDSCSEEVFSSEFLQVWQNADGEIMGFLWFDDLAKNNQCIVLRDMEFHRDELTVAKELRALIHRRWHLCLRVEQSRDEVFRDSLTDLYNQRYLNQLLSEKIKEQERYKTPFTILFIDVDHFKKVNDSKGHLVGSSILIELGKLLKSCIRETDAAFRYGGDEFIILLGHTEGEQAFLVAERIRQKVEAAKFSVRKNNVQVTVSIGLASYPKHASSAEEIIQIADEAMYYGKHKSRNIVYKAS